MSKQKDSTQSGYAQLEIFHSRPVVPTRRICLGKQILDSQPVSSSDLTLGGLLLASVVGRYASSIHPDLWEDVELLINNVERKKRTPQPFMRFRLQTDKVGLSKTSHTLTQFANGTFKLEIAAVRGSSVQQFLGALYVASSLEDAARTSCIAAIRMALSWWGSDADRLLEYLLNAKVAGAGEDSDQPISWALNILGIEADKLVQAPTGSEIQRHFRQKLWNIHPDRGGDPILASQLIPELAEARRVLLSSNLVFKK